MVTEREKMLAGRLYKASDPELIDLRQRASIITRMFNTEKNQDQAQALIKTFLGQTGQTIAIAPPFVCDYGSNIYLGENFSADSNCTFIDVCEIRIGANAHFGSNCQVLTSLHPLDEKEYLVAGKEFGSPISIGNNVWCGDGVVILPGVSLGDNVRVAPGTVVTKSFGDNLVIAGNPAQVVKDMTADAYLSIDIGGSFIKHALIDQDLELSEQGQVPTPKTLEDFWTSLAELIEPYLDKIRGIGISCPGEISKNGRIFRGGLIPYLKNIPLAKRLSDQYALPVSVLNDASAAALAETQTGSLKDSQCGAILVLGTGVGLGLVSDNQLVSLPGKSLRPEHPNLGDSQESIWEQVSQIFELNRLGLESLKTNAGSAVNFVEQASQLLGLDEADGRKVFAALDKGKNQQLQDLFENYCREIAYLVLNLQTLLKVDALAIGGGISSQALLVQEINRQYSKLFNSVLAFQHYDLLTIKSATNHNNANLIGAYLNLKK